MSGSLSGISFSGISSGIDTDSIISKLLQLEAIPIQRLQTQQAQLQSKQNLLAQFKSKVTAVSVAAGALNSASAFNPIGSNSSNKEVATVTATSDSVAGTYDISVTKLAQANKISSTAQTDTTSALGFSGKMTVNGKGITIEASDTLKTIATKINSASANVTASVIDGGTGNAFITLTAKSTGASSEIQIADLDGTVASSLGLANGALAYRETIMGGATSADFSSSTTALGSMLGFTGLGSQSFTLNGTAISVNLDTATLQTLASSINSSGSGAVASVRSVTENGVTVQKLDLTGVTTYDDSDGVLQGLGILQKAYGNELVIAQDAEYEVDNVNLTSSSNTITGIIPGATLTLLKANATTPETTTITLSRDDSEIKKKIQDFATAFNSLVDYVKANTKFDTDTFQTGGLFGESVVQQVEAGLGNAVFGSITGLSTYTNLTQLGFSFDSSGKLEIDDTKLSDAIGSNATAVGNLFRAIGTSTTTQLSYIASTSSSKGGTYSVNITQAALQHSLLGEIAQTSAISAQETLTFDGDLFGDTPYNLILEAGLTQSQIVDKINSDSKLKDMITATVDSGKLKLTSKKYGATAQYTVTSSLAAAADNSGIGTVSVVTTGTDVAGTIGGEAATGFGQVLKGNDGNANTEGLQVMYTGTASGSIGTLTFTKGVSSAITQLVTTYTDGINGLLTASDNTLTDQIDTFDQRITDLQARLVDKQTELKTKFARMEQALAELQSQSSRISQGFGLK